MSDYKIKHKTHKDRTYIYAESTKKKNEKGLPLQIAHLAIPHDLLGDNSFSAGDLYVSTEFRRKGLATEMFKYAEKLLGVPAKPGQNQSPEAKEFWRQPNRPFGIKSSYPTIHKILSSFKTLTLKEKDKDDQSDIYIWTDGAADYISRHPNPDLMELGEDYQGRWGFLPGTDVRFFEPRFQVEGASELVLYHLTDNERFKLDPNYAPEDNSMAIEDRSGRKGIYLAKNVEKWLNGYGYWRPFVVELNVDPSVVKDVGVHGRYGGEMFIPASSYDKLTIKRVIPLDAYAREEFGSYGWIEGELRREFDTGNKIPRDADVYPFTGYKYAGKDVRSMSSSEVSKLKQQFKSVKPTAEGQTASYNMKNFRQGKVE